MTSIASFDAEAITDQEATIGIVILSDVRLVRDALTEIFERSGKLQVLGVAAELGAAFEQGLARQPDIILVDTVLPEGQATVRYITQRVPAICVVALALAEREDEVIAWIEAGVSGYIPRSAALDQVVPFLQAVARGEQTCSPRVASSLVRRLAIDSIHKRPAEPINLTRRELEIIQLIGEDLTNKEIAYRLGIGLATAKSHVHNLLAKLGVGHRSQAARWVRERGRTSRHPPGTNVNPAG